MVKAGKWIAKHRFIILLLGILLLIPSFIGMAKTRINYDLLSYLPESLETVEGQDVMVDEYGMGAFAMVVVEDTDMKDIQKLADQFNKVDHVEKVLWYGDVADLSLPVEMIPSDLRKAFYNGDATLMLALFDNTTSSDEAMNAVGEMRKIASKQCFIAGTLQSSEVAKFEMILFSSHLAAKAPQVERLDPERRILLTPREWLRVRVWKQLVVPVLPLIPVVILLAMEPHMSGIVLTVAVVGTILLLSGSGGVLTWAGAITAGALLETLLSHVDSIPYLQKRLDGWTQDLSQMTDQTVQSLYAIGSGGLKGLGLGNSVEKQLWLPESTNDFIFSVVCEELGFIGAVLIIVLFVLFIVQGLLIAYKAENLYCTMVGIGIMAQIAWQVFCNIAVVTNTLPNTGISLPFFSSGGTSLILLLAEMGVMVNIGRNGERAAQQREQMRAQREAARAEREAELARKTIDLASARAARTEQ